MKRTATLVSFASCVLASMSALAQDGSDDWSIRLSPYLWAVSIDGETQTGTLPPADVDAGFDDILSNANFAASLNTEFAKGRWAFVVDPTYISLEAEDVVSGTLGNLDLDIDIWLVELWAAYEIVDHWELLAGTRWQSQSIDASGSLNLPPPGPNPIDAEIADEDWTDFFAGVRAQYGLSDKWLLSARVDVAFAGDSDSSLNAIVLLNRYVGQGRSKLLNIGYRYFDDDYETGSGADFFRWDVEEQGPYLGFSWVFGGGS